jgi:hypothetical protein
MAQGESSEGRISTELRDGVFLIGIDRPAKLNGFTPQMLRGMAQAYTAYEHEGAARCAVVHAEGKHFTAGLDLPKVAPHLGSDALMVEEGEIDPFDLRAPFRSKPVVFAVHGICFTLGIEMMLAADIVIAASDTRFSQLEVKRDCIAAGFCPGSCRVGPPVGKGDGAGATYRTAGAARRQRDDRQCTSRTGGGASCRASRVWKNPEKPARVGRLSGRAEKFQGKARTEVFRPLKQLD